MAINTVIRGMLKNRARDGRLMARCDYRLTDDYRYDAATDFGKTEFMPVELDEGQSWRDRKEGVMYLRPDYFKGHGRAWKNSDGTICLIVHSNLSYTLKIV